MIFKDKDRECLREITNDVNNIKGAVSDLNKLHAEDYNKVFEKLDFISNNIGILSDRVNRLDAATATIASALQDLGNALHAIRELSKADDEVRAKELKVVSEGIKFIAGMLDSQVDNCCDMKADSYDDTLIDHVPVVNVVRSRRRRFVTLHTQHRSHR